jgi:drug/metabolite transporter (DMT)-like permease
MIKKKQTVWDNTPFAVVTIVVTVFLLAFGDAIIKRFSTSLTLWQIFTIRSLIVIPFLLGAIFIRVGRLSFWPSQPGWTALRSLMLTLMWVAYYIALPRVDLSIAAASYYTLPLFITLFAACLLGDPVGKRGWAAMVVGFSGVVLVLQPDADRFNWYALLPILSAVLYALAMILTRSRCRFENVLVLSLWLNLSMLLIGGLGSLLVLTIGTPAAGMEPQDFLLGRWSGMGRVEWAVIAILSTVIVLASIGAAIAYQIGRPATVAAFDFGYVGFAAIWGIIIFQESPDWVTITGIVLIITAGVLATLNPSAQKNRRVKCSGSS